MMEQFFPCSEYVVQHNSIVDVSWATALRRAAWQYQKPDVTYKWSFSRCKQSDEAILYPYCGDVKDCEYWCSSPCTRWSGCWIVLLNSVFCCVGSVSIFNTNDKTLNKLSREHHVCSLKHRPNMVVITAHVFNVSNYTGS